MQELGVLGHPDYKLVCLLDHAAMVTVRTERYGVFDCKPLQFVWAKFGGAYGAGNTVMLDDLRYVGVVFCSVLLFVLLCCLCLGRVRFFCDRQ